MMKWYEPGRWLLIAALAAQFAGCAQTSQWVSRATGRNQPEETAEIDGRDETAAKQKEKVKIASDSEAKEKPARTVKPQPKEEPRIAASPKPKSTAADTKQNEIAQASDSDRGLIDPFEESSEEVSSTQRWSARSLLPKRFGSLNDLAKKDRPTKPEIQDESASEPIVAANEEPEATEEVTAASATAPSAAVDEAIARKLTQLKPSQASFTQTCPNATGEVRELVKSLDEDNVELVKRSLHRLGRIGPDAAAALPAIKCFLTNADGYVRVHAALAMCRIEGISPTALSTLTAALDSPDAGLRSFSAAVIAELGPESGDAKPALAAALKDPNAYVRLHVAEVLIRDAEWSERSLDVLLSCLNHRDENVRWLTAYSLAELAPQSPEAVEALAAQLDDPSAKVQIGAAYALAEIGPLSQPALADLNRHARDRNPELRTAVSYAVEQITKDGGKE